MRIRKLLLLALLVVATPFIWIAGLLSMLWTTAIFAVHIGRLAVARWWQRLRK